MQKFDYYSDSNVTLKNIIFGEFHITVLYLNINKYYFKVLNFFNCQGKVKVLAMCSFPELKHWKFKLNFFNCLGNCSKPRHFRKCLISAIACDIYNFEKKNYFSSVPRCCCCCSGGVAKPEVDAIIFSLLMRGNVVDTDWDVFVGGKMSTIFDVSKLLPFRPGQGQFHQQSYSVTVSKS